MKRWLPEVLCGAVLCVILSLGLWPFHVPQNDVTWLQTTNGLHFGKYSTVLSSGKFQPQAGERPFSSSLEIWLQPTRIWDSGTFLAFYDPGNPRGLSLRQWQTDLLVKSGQELQLDNVFRRTGPAFLTITTGLQGTRVYVDGAAAKSSPEVRLSADAFAGQLVLGDAPRQSDTWSGRLLGLAIYPRELAPPEVREHFLSWTRQKKPEAAADERALYLFDEHKGRVIHSQAGPGVDLYIPQKYVVLDQLFLEDPWSEYRRTQGFWGAVLKNIVGFVPLGCCFYAYFTVVRQIRHPVLTTILIGTAVSLAIEVVQAFLPMRDSGMMDLVTNTLGTSLGVLACKALNAQGILRPWYAKAIAGSTAAQNRFSRP